MAQLATRGNHQHYAEAALCTGFIVYYMKIVFKAFVLMKPVIKSSVNSQCVCGEMAK